MSFKNKLQSRKYQLVILVITLATVGAFIPPVLSIFLAKPLVILTGTEYVSLISLIIGAYFGANVIQKRWDTPEITPEESGVEYSNDKEI